MHCICNYKAVQPAQTELFLHYIVMTFGIFAGYVAFMKTEVYQLRLDSDLKKRIEKLAEKKGISVAGLMRMLLLAELEKEGMGRKEPNPGEDDKTTRPE